MAKQKIDLKQHLLEDIRLHPNSSSKEIDDRLNGVVGYATVKRTIQLLLTDRLIEAIGKGKATKYKISKAFELINQIDVEQYFQKEIDERKIKTQFNHALITETLGNISVFTKDELKYLDDLQTLFTKNISTLSKTEYKKEFERLAIDLSWKSSQIEGNTYSLLETERLLKEQKTAAGKTKDEASMLLNHKAALDFILDDPSYLNPLTTARIEDIHSILIKDLDVSRNVRNRKVGISGTNYQPLDNEFQIKEVLNDMCALINKHNNIFEKALLALVLISYIQPFADGSKRTARISSNALLITYNYCPISFRTVDSIDYKKAMLIFYEQNNLSAFKKIFMEQFEFAVKTYF
jgi:Fic family protein